VIVSITSVRPGGLRPDPACVLHGGEHPFITGECFAFYQRTEWTTVRSLQAKVDRKEVILKPSADGALIRQIRNAAMESEFTDPSVIRALRECPWDLDNPEH
jgi:hypothetical protein